MGTEIPGDPANERDESSEHDESSTKHPKIDVSAALGEAGHEVEELGFEGVPDTGPVLRGAGDQEQTEDVDDALDAATMVYPSD